MRIVIYQSTNREGSTFTGPAAGSGACAALGAGRRARGRFGGWAGAFVTGRRVRGRQARAPAARSGPAARGGGALGRRTCERSVAGRRARGVPRRSRCGLPWWAPDVTVGTYGAGARSSRSVPDSTGRVVEGNGSATGCRAQTWRGHGASGGGCRS